MPFAYDKDLGSRKIGAYESHNRVVSIVQLNQNYYNIGDTFLKFFSSSANKIWDYQDEKQIAMNHNN